MKDNFSDSVYIIDSYGLIYRAYYALFNHPLTNLKGEKISAVIIELKKDGTLKKLGEQFFGQDVSNK